MTRRTAFLIAVLLILGGSAWAELELGFGIAPPIGQVPQTAQQGDFFSGATKVVHVGYSFLYLFYLTYDGLILPPYSVSTLTQTIDQSTGSFTPGYYRPGFLNTFDVGFRPKFGPLTLMAAVGVNQLYVLRQGPDNLNIPPMGVNLKLGLGWRITSWLGLNFVATTVFADFATLQSTLKGLSSSDALIKQKSQDAIINNLYPAALIQLCL